MRLREAMEQVTAPQVEALMLLREHPEGLSMHELAAAEGSTPSSATQMVDRLIRLGMVERLREDADRRVVRVQLSATALERFREVMVARVRALEGVTAALSDTELRTLVQLLEKLAR
jgi:MarR family transcriptional regulator, organic hydroperoxide resistance regulator